MKKIIPPYRLQTNTTDEKHASDLPQLLTQQEVADIIRKHPRWLERKRWEGGGPPFRYIGQTPLYEMQALLEWLDEQPCLKHTSEKIMAKK